MRRMKKVLAATLADGSVAMGVGLPKSADTTKKYSIIFITFLFCVYEYSITRVYGFILFPDEFGYWSYAAKLAGYDWSDIVSLGSYYSYGYSLILFPIFLLCKDAILAYRVAVSINFVLLAGGYVILLGIVKKLDDGSNVKEHIYMGAAIAMTYPSWLFYAKTTMVEIVLVVLLILIGMLLLNYLEHNRVSVLIMLVLALVYIHFLHMRAVAVTLAGGVTLFVYFVKHSKKIKQLFLMLLMGVLILGIGMVAKEWLQAKLYAGTEQEMLHINDYAGQLEKLSFLLSKEGIYNLVCGISGKILYLGLSSFGIVYWGVWHCIKEIRKLLKCLMARKEIDDKKLIYVFVLLTLVGELLINVIYNIRPYRVDSVVYGRYHEFVLPVFMVWGIMEMLRSSKTICGMTLIGIVQIPMLLLVIHNVNHYQLTNMHGYIMVGISYLDGIKELSTNQFLGLTYVLLMLLSFAVTVIIVAEKKWNTNGVILIMVVVLEFVLSVRASELYIDTSSIGAFRDSIVAEKIEELRKDNDDRRVVYIQENEEAFISIMQFMLRDIDIELLQYRKTIEEYANTEIDADDIILLSYDSAYTNEVEKKYQNTMLNGHFVIYYNNE